MAGAGADGARARELGRGDVGDEVAALGWSPLRIWGQTCRHVACTSFIFFLAFYVTIQVVFLHRT